MEKAPVEKKVEVPKFEAPIKADKKVKEFSVTEAEPTEPAKKKPRKPKTPKNKKNKKAEGPIKETNEPT